MSPYLVLGIVLGYFFVLVFISLTKARVVFRSRLSIKYTTTNKNIKVKLHNKLNALKLRAEIQNLIDPKNDSNKLEIVVTPAERPTENKE